MQPFLKLKIDASSQNKIENEKKKSQNPNASVKCFPINAIPEY